MIEFERVSFTYDGAATPTLAGLDLRVTDGELCLLVGATGTGKSTLLRLVNGLSPHFTGGTLAGDVRVDGRDTRTHPPRELADVVGYVGQNPAAGFVTARVEDELAYTMESLGLAPAVMRRRVEDALDLLGLVDLRDRAPQQLSGGQQQRVAIAAVLTANPTTLVLDEPTSALDPQSAESVLAALTRLVHDLGMTVLVAEHRLERVLGYADTMIWLPGDGERAVCGPTAQVAADCPLCPPVADLGRRAGWRPVPLTVRDARARAGGLRARLAERAPAPTRTGVPAAAASPEPVAGTDGLTVRRGARTAPVTAVRDLTLRLRPGRVCAVMGRNGSGKSTLLESLAGLHEATDGRAWLGDPGRDPRALTAAGLIRHVGLVPQQPADLLYLSTVAAECAEADARAGAAPGTCAGLLAELAGPVLPGRHPRDLSEGQRLGLALAIVLTAAPPVLLLDEPTRGLDYPAKQRLATILRAQARSGRAVCFASHDVELVAAVADEVVLLAQGDVVDAGPTAAVVTASPVFAPQMAKVFRPVPVLTVDEVAARLGLPAAPDRVRR